LETDRNAPTLVANNIEKQFGAVKAVDKVSLTLHKGQCLALLGPNGAGKTTTCEMLEGLIMPDRGEIKVLGMEYARDRSNILEKIGVQLQETSLYKRYTVRETLDLFASFYRSPISTQTIIEKLDLGEKAETKLMQLSGGQKQRVYLGCALINSPEILFLDEPTTGLDPQARRNIWEKVEELKRENRSILLTTHYMEEAERLADVVAIMDAGKVIALGSPQELIQNHCAGELVTMVLTKTGQTSDQIKGTLVGRLAGFAEATLTADGRFELTVALASIFLQQLVRVTDELGITVQSLAMRPGTLEDVFIKLTGRSMRDD
jgi:ABC-2 type transport system ATP-binding protein